MNAPVFQLWQTIEALTPIEAMRINYSDKRSPVYGVAPHAAMPWDDPSHKRKPIDAGWQWFHYAQCAIYSTDEVSRLLVAAISGSDGQWQENTGGTSRLFDLSFDELGHPQPHSFSLSMAAWASGQLLRTKGDVALFLAGGNPDFLIGDTGAGGFAGVGGQGNGRGAVPNRSRDVYQSVDWADVGGGPGKPVDQLCLAGWRALSGVARPSDRYGQWGVAGGCRTSADGGLCRE